ncbi:MAG: hypothetical protein AB7N54_20260 [Alphaproteobacteria bacterium]
MTRLLVTIAAFGILAGCAAVDRQEMSEFEPLEGGKFRYEVVADVVYPAGSDSAETERMAWLATWLEGNKLCPAGYEITERKPVLIREALLGPVHRIYYTGHCKDHGATSTSSR